MKFRDQVLAIDNSIKHIPSGYKRLGNTVILRSSHTLSNRLGDIVLEIFPWCKGVFHHKTTIGEYRKPELKHLAGSATTDILHKENGVTYLLDIANITFSGGNSQLRRELIDRVTAEENLLDMFAAVGNLSLQLLVKKQLNSLLIEKNALTFSYLEKTLEINGINKKIAFNIDCRDLQLENWADRIFMGYHNVDLSHIKAAVRTAKMFCVVHLHPLAKPKKYEEWINRYQSWFKQCETEVLSFKVKKVKNYSPGLEHIEIEFIIRK